MQYPSTLNESRELLARLHPTWAHGHEHPCSGMVQVAAGAVCICTATLVPQSDPVHHAAIRPILGSGEHLPQVGLALLAPAPAAEFAAAVGGHLAPATATAAVSAGKL